MSWWLPHNFKNKRKNLEKRSQIITALRRFFDDQGFTEVHTPALQVCPTIDAHIHGFQTNLRAVDMSHKRVMYLQTSPEFDMKKLLVAGMEKIYQICPVFRDAEGSKLHSPEFMLLEWYRSGSNYEKLMDDSVDILRYVAESIGVQEFSYVDKICDPFKATEKLSVSDAFLRFFEIDLSLYLNDLDSFSKVISNKGVRVVDSDGWDDVFHAAMAERIEPNLGIGAPTILYDYPVSMAALSKKGSSDPRFAERFELYMCGIELANAFSELTDAKEQRERYENDMKLKQELYNESYPADEEFFAALEHGMPESAGIALGVDRLVMLACGAEMIEQVLWAPVQTD